MAMVPYVIRQGDYLSRLAHEMGFDADTVWNHASNGDLRRRRPQRDVLQPGDILFVPTPSAPRRLKVEHGQANRYVCKVPTVEVRITFAHPQQGPLAGKAYRVEGVQPPMEGTTDASGTATLHLPMDVREVQVIFADILRRFPVRVGDMDPIDGESGVRKRLMHLGYYWDHLGDGETDRAGFADAVRAFQRARGLGATGQLDDATRDALRSAHGG